jgi:hypothetical protein
MEAEEAESLVPGVGGILRARRVVTGKETIGSDDVCEHSRIVKSPTTLLAYTIAEMLNTLVYQTV